MLSMTISVQLARLQIMLAISTQPSAMIRSGVSSAAWPLSGTLTRVGKLIPTAVFSTTARDGTSRKREGLLARILLVFQEGSTLMLTLETIHNDGEILWVRTFGVSPSADPDSLDTG